MSVANHQAPRITKETIRQAALAAGFADAAIFGYEDRDMDCGQWRQWHVLSIKRAVDSPWEIVCRRRSKIELLEAIENPRYQQAAPGMRQ